MLDPLRLEDEIVTALRRINQAIDLHSRTLLGRCGLTLPQLAALRAIARLQPITVGALARAIHVGQATMTGVLSRLDARGLVVRKRAQYDRRSITVELTAAGEELVAEAPSPLDERLRQGLLALEPWEQTMILSALQRVAAMTDGQVREPASAGNGAADALSHDDAPEPGGKNPADRSPGEQGEKFA